MARSKQMEALKELAKQAPPEQNRLEYLAELARQPDRVTAIVAVAGLEHILKETICRHLRPGFSKEDQIFDYNNNGILSTFGSQVTIACAMGIFGEQERADFSRLLRIRNAFAHSMMNIDFSAVPIPSIVSDLEILNRPGTPEVFKQPAPIKHKFLHAVCLYYILLLIYRPNSSGVDHGWLVKPLSGSPTG